MAWRWMFGSAALPAFAFIVCLGFVPESPRWLIQQHRDEEAGEALRTIGGDAHMTETLIEIKSAIAEEEAPPGWMRRMRRPLILAIVVAALQQMTGINTVIYYGSMLFVAHGNSGSPQMAFAANVLIGLTNFVFTLVALVVMDRIGRRILLGGSALVMFIALVLLVFEFHSAQTHFVLIVASTMLYVAKRSPQASDPEHGFISLKFFPQTFADAPCPWPLQCCGQVAFLSRTRFLR